MLINGQKSFCTYNRRKAAVGFAASADACDRDHHKSHLRTRRRNNNNLLGVFGDGKAFSVVCWPAVDPPQGQVDQNLHFRHVLKELKLELLADFSALLQLQRRGLVKEGDQMRLSLIHCWY